MRRRDHDNDDDRQGWVPIDNNAGQLRLHSHAHYDRPSAAQGGVIAVKCLAADWNVDVHMCWFGFVGNRGPVMHMCTCGWHACRS